MPNPFFATDTLHAPYFIFIRAKRKFTDAQLRRRFGLLNYQYVTVESKDDLMGKLKQYAIITDDGEWLLLADDWFYTLWHMQSTQKVIKELGKQYDIFTCSIGDADRSFEFMSYQNGKLIRHYVVESPNYDDQQVTKDFGTPLPGERAAFNQNDEYRLVLLLATSLGIRIQFRLQDVRIYQPVSQ